MADFCCITCRGINVARLRIVNEFCGGMVGKYMAEAVPKNYSPATTYCRYQWAMQVAFVVLPLILFLFIVWVFMDGDQQLRSVGATIEEPSGELVDYATARLGVVILDYSIHVYVHVIVSLVAIYYFLSVMRNHARTRLLTIRFEIGFAMLFTFLVGAAVVIMTIGQPLPKSCLIFSGLYIAPFEGLFDSLELKDKLSGHSWKSLSFFHVSVFHVSVLMPTLFGLVSVIFCTAAFHHIVCSRRPMKTNVGQDDVVHCITTLKRQLTFLSVVFVTSALTSRAYVHMLPSLVGQDETAHKIYSALASTLSFASSMLFTATVLAAFAPGVTSLLRDITRLSSDESPGDLTAILERLNISRPIDQLVGIVRMVLTLAAPALADRVMDVLSIP